ncbi:carboxy-terminal processing protease CtpA [soil metagenome]
MGPLVKSRQHPLRPLLILAGWGQTMTDPEPTPDAGTPPPPPPGDSLSAARTFLGGGTLNPERPLNPKRSRTAFLRRPGPFTSALALVVTMLLIASTAMLGYRVGSRSGGAELADGFGNIERVFEAIESDAVDDVDDQLLIDGAIDGLLEALDDQYAVYYDPERYIALNADLDGEFVGIGVTIEEQSDGVYVTGVLPGSPAEEAGVMAGERITSVDGTSALDETTSGEVIELIAGDEGTERVIGFDKGDEGPRELTLTLRQLDLPQVASRTLESGYGYISVTQFSRHIAEQMTDELETFDDQDVPGVVLDLRSNPGGLLNEAVDVVSLFAEEGLVVRVDSRDGSQERNVSGKTVAPELPLVVLVDGNSASASEIVAGALQDLDRAEIVGEATFGKGTVQTIQDLADGAGVKFTTARYYTPSGDSIEGLGVVPDVEAEGDPDEMLAAAEDVLAKMVSVDGS